MKEPTSGMGFAQQSGSDEVRSMSIHLLLVRRKVEHLRRERPESFEVPCIFGKRVRSILDCSTIPEIGRFSTGRVQFSVW